MACTTVVQDDADPQFVRQGCVSFLDGVAQRFRVSGVMHLSSPIVNKLRKEDLVTMVIDSLCCLNDLVELTTDFKLATKCMKNELTESHKSIIELQ